MTYKDKLKEKSKSMGRAYCKQCGTDDHIIEKGYERLYCTKCKSFAFGCPNCFGHLLIDMLQDEIDTMKQDL